MPSSEPYPVLHVVTTTARRGAEVFGADLGEALAARGWPSECVALVPGSSGHDLPIEVLGTRRLAPATLRRLRARAAGRLAVAHGSSTLAACAFALRRGAFVYRTIGDPGYWSGGRIRAARVGVLIRRARLVVALTEGIAATLRRRYGLAPDRLRVVPKGVPAARFPHIDAARRAGARRVLGLEAGALFAVVLGALSAEKDVGTAIEAVGRVARLRLLVVGDGAERERLERLAEEVAPGRVRFTGSVADPAPYLAASDVLLLTSRTEGLPGALIEAGLTGLPVVASAVGGVAEIVADGETGILVPPGDADAAARAVGRVLDDPVPLGTAARERCLDRFEIGAVADAWERLLVEVGPRGA